MAAVNSFSLLAVAGASVGVGGVAFILTVLLSGKSRKLSLVDRGVVVWLLYDAITHLVLVSGKTCYSRYVGGSNGLHDMHHLYAVAMSQVDPEILKRGEGLRHEGQIHEIL